MSLWLLHGLHGYSGRPHTYYFIHTVGQYGFFTNILTKVAIMYILPKAARIPKSKTKSVCKVRHYHIYMLKELLCIQTLKGCRLTTHGSSSKQRMNCKGTSTLTSTSIELDQNISSNQIRYGSKTIQNIFSQITRRRLFASNYIQMVVSSLSSLVSGLTWPFPLCWLIPVRLEWLSQENGNNILTATLSEQDNSLDTKIEVEEVEYAICHLNQNLIWSHQNI